MIGFALGVVFTVVVCLSLLAVLSRVGLLRDCRREAEIEARVAALSGRLKDVEDSAESKIAALAGQLAMLGQNGTGSFDRENPPVGRDFESVPGLETG